MTQKTFNLVAGTLFALIAALHLLRLVRHWDALIGGRPVPMGASVVALLVTGFLAFQAFRLKK